MRKAVSAAVVAFVLACAGQGGPRAAFVALPLDSNQAPTRAPDALRVQARELLRTAIAFRTVAGQGQVPRFAADLASRFRSAGFPPDDVHVVPVGETASLVVRYRGRGTGGRPILFLAHMDVVPASTADWKRDPFTLVEENGFFVGRGTADVKGEVASLSTTFMRLKTEGFVPRRDLVLVFTGDEETGMTTARDLVTKHRDLVEAEFALNADGGGGQLSEVDGSPQIYFVQGAEKTYASFTLTARNPGGHSSEPRADNAIYRLAHALEALEHHRFPVMWNDWTLDSLKATASETPGRLGEALARFAANPRDEAAADVLFASPEYVGKTRTTCVATMIRGGHADNALPQSATAHVNCRVFPGTRIDDVQGALQQVAGEGIEVRRLGSPNVSEASPIRPDVMAAVTKALQHVYPKVPLVRDMASYATDAAVFRSAGIPTYGVSSIFLKSSDDFSHGLNERIPAAVFYAGLDYWYALMKELG